MKKIKRFSYFLKKKKKKKKEHCFEIFPSNTWRRTSLPLLHGDKSCLWPSSVCRAQWCHIRVSLLLIFLERQLEHLMCIFFFFFFFLKDSFFFIIMQVPKRISCSASNLWERHFFSSGLGSSSSLCLRAVRETMTCCQFNHTTTKSLVFHAAVDCGGDQILVQ